MHNKTSTFKKMHKSDSVQSSISIGFLADYRRLNVAITRARLALWMVGDCRALSRSSHFKALIDDAVSRDLYCYVFSFFLLSLSFLLF